MLRRHFSYVGFDSVVALQVGLKSGRIEGKQDGDRVFGDNCVCDPFFGVLASFADICADGRADNKLDRFGAGDM